ncbi:MAG TPA: hypothetical protein VFF69_03640 [Phycisphaerales bacterium]|nr:hypothetical protein [Phycisphaerales bacterium]
MIELHPIEQLIIDRPDFQRLRFVSQQGLAHYTYPSDQHSRAPHSFGAMHLAGRMLKRALENARLPVLERFLWDARDLIATIAHAHSHKEARVIHGAAELIHNAVGFNHRPYASNDRLGPGWVHPKGKWTHFNSDPGTPFDYQMASYVIAVLWQAVRVASLIHDIGHLPYSHTFEHAIDDLWLRARRKQVDEDPPRSFAAAFNELHTRFDTVFRNLLKQLDMPRRVDDPGDSPQVQAKPRIPPHEQIGILLCDVFPFESELRTPSQQALWQVTTTIGRLVFGCNPELYEGASAENSPLQTGRFAVIQALHSIMSGELDADRLDYSVRDTATAAAGFDSIDIEEIVENLQLVSLPTGGSTEASNPYAIAVRAKAIPQVETFFTQRFMAYRAIVGHHNVARFDAILGAAIKALIESSQDQGSVLYPLLRGRGFGGFYDNAYKFGPFNPDTYRRFDDCWLRSVCQEALECLSARTGEPLKPHDLQTHLLLETLLERKTSNLLSLFKNEGHRLAWRTDLVDRLGRHELFASEELARELVDRVFATDWDDIPLLMDDDGGLFDPVEFVEMKLLVGAREVTASKDAERSVVLPLLSFCRPRLLDKRPMDVVLDMAETLPIRPGPALAGRVAIACSASSDLSDVRDLPDASLTLRGLARLLATFPRLNLAFVGRAVRDADNPNRLRSVALDAVGDLCVAMRNHELRTERSAVA